MSLITMTKMQIKRISDPELMKMQDIINDEVARRENSKQGTKGEQL